MFGKGYEEFFPVFADKSQHTRLIASRGHGCRNCPFGDFQRVVDSTGTGAEKDGSQLLILYRLFHIVYKSNVFQANNICPELLIFALKAKISGTWA